jgi:hypothetical protein
MPSPETNPTKKPRGPGRPATGATVKKVSITLPEQLWERAGKYCFENGSALSKLISEALKKELEGKGHLTTEKTREEKTQDGKT